MAEVQSRPRVLCVDDDPRVLEGLTLTLGRRYAVETAPSGIAGLEVLTARPGVEVVVSDMRMPGMDGAAFLTHVRTVAPNATRVLLTGETDLNGAISAVNEGQIFRFLLKPTPPPVLVAAIEAAREQYRLVTAERVLLEQTLRGSIQALTDVLALTSPLAFGHASRLKALATILAPTLLPADVWKVEVAAMLSQLGASTLPAELAERVARGETSTPDERVMIEKAGAAVDRILAAIPRLDEVRAIVAFAARDQGGGRNAGVLRLAREYDALVTAGGTPGGSLGVLRGRMGRHEAALLDALAAHVHVAGKGAQIRELTLAQLRPGMVLADEARLSNGALLAARGYEITDVFLARAANFARGGVKEPVRVVVRDAS